MKKKVIRAHNHAAASPQIIALATSLIQLLSYVDKLESNSSQWNHADTCDVERIRIEVAVLQSLFPELPR